MFWCNTHILFLKSEKRQICLIDMFPFNNTFNIQPTYRLSCTFQKVEANFSFHHKLFWEFIMVMVKKKINETLNYTRSLSTIKYQILNVWRYLFQVSPNDRTILWCGSWSILWSSEHWHVQSFLQQQAWVEFYLLFRVSRCPCLW